MKVCLVCQQEKSDEDFSWLKKSEGRRKNLCRACFNEAGKKRYAANLQKERERGRKKLQNPGVKEKVASRSRAWYAANKKRHRQSVMAWHEAHREQVRAYQKEHYEANKAEYFEKTRRRRAVKLERQVEYFTAKQVDARMSVFGHRCAYCAGPFEEVDHVIPLARGGMHCLANLRPACRSCNRRKSAKPINAWLSEVA